jgi:hypothetical protein
MMTVGVWGAIEAPVDGGVGNIEVLPNLKGFGLNLPGVPRLNSEHHMTTRDLQ